MEGEWLLSVEGRVHLNCESGKERVAGSENVK